MEKHFLYLQVETSNSLPLTIRTLYHIPLPVIPLLFRNVFDLHSPAPSQSESDQMLLIHERSLPRLHSFSDFKSQGRDEASLKDHPHTHRSQRISPSDSPTKNPTCSPELKETCCLEGITKVSVSHHVCGQTPVLFADNISPL